jgi:chromosome segregation ATPase
MDIKTIETLIASVGFPIVCVLGMGYFIYQLYKQSVLRENTLYTQIEESRTVNAKAIDTIAKYAERLDTIQQDVKDIKNDVITIKAKSK